MQVSSTAPPALDLSTGLMMRRLFFSFELVFASIRICSYRQGAVMGMGLIVIVGMGMGMRRVMSRVGSTPMARAD